jgi:hypothetical protein
MVIDEVDGGVFFEVNFGEYLGVQMVSAEVCKPWAVPTMTKEKDVAIDGVFHATKADICTEVDMVGMSSVMTVDTALLPKQPPNLSRANDRDGYMTMVTMSHARHNGGAEEPNGVDSDPEWVPVIDVTTDPGGDNSDAIWGFSYGILR